MDISACLFIKPTLQLSSENSIFIVGSAGARNSVQFSAMHPLQGREERSGERRGVHPMSARHTVHALHCIVL